MNFKKRTEERAREYLDDSRWGKVSVLCDKGKFADANELHNKIVDSYPFHIRQKAADLDEV